MRYLAMKVKYKNTNTSASDMPIKEIKGMNKACPAIQELDIEDLAKPWPTVLSLIWMAIKKVSEL